MFNKLILFPVEKMIQKFKFKNHPAVGIGLGKIMAENLDLSLINKKFDFIILVFIKKDCVNVDLIRLKLWRKKLQKKYLSR